MMSTKFMTFLVSLLLALTFDPTSGMEFNLNSSSEFNKDMTCSFDGSTSEILGIIQINVIAIMPNTEKRLASISKMEPSNVTIDHVFVVSAVGDIKKNVGFLKVEIRSASGILKFACRGLVLDKDQKTITIEKEIVNKDNPLMADFNDSSSSYLADTFNILEEEHKELEDKLQLKVKTIEELSGKVDHVERFMKSIMGTLGGDGEAPTGVAQTIATTKMAVENNKRQIVFLSSKINALAEMLGTIQAGIMYDLGKMSEKIGKTANFSKVVARRADASSCRELKDRGFTHFPRVTISTQGGNNLLCETSTDGGGWIIFQRRINGLVDFYRNWEEYENGFGSFHSSFWLGLKRISNMTAEGEWELRVDFKYKDVMYFAEYSKFKVGDSGTNYKLQVSGYTGTAGDSLSYHNEKAFSTFDNNNDIRSQDCAERKRAAWWYENCQHVHLNGQWGSKEDEAGINWRKTTGTKDSATFTEMKMRRVE